MRELEVTHWLMIALFVAVAIMLSFSAWQGEKFAIVSLAVGLVVIATINQLYRQLTGKQNKLAQELIDDLKIEHEYSQKLIEGYTNALNSLAEHDAELSELHAHGLRKTIEGRWPDIKDDPRWGSGPFGPSPLGEAMN